MDILTLAMAKAYTDEMCSGTGNGVPYFDLAEMGLPAVSIGGQQSISVDTSAVMDALDKGVVKFRIKVNFGAEIDVYTVAVGFYAPAMGAYQSNTFMTYGSDIYLFGIQVSEGGITCLARMM